jgi:hypothetical protein
MTDERIYLKELAELLDRTPNSIRSWVREDRLPEELKPMREGGRQQLFWKQAQLSALREFAREMEQRRGWPGSKVA